MTSTTPIRTGVIVYSDEKAREAFRAAGVGLSDCRLSRTPDAAWELRSARGALIATVNSSGIVSREARS